MRVRNSASPASWRRVWKRQAARPAALTSRIAASAWRSSSSRLAPSAGCSAMPTLAVTVKLRPSSVKGRCSASITRRAAASAPAASERCTSSTNSSPPRRATLSIWRTPAARRSPISTSTRSPKAWPRVSLMCLKWSRSSCSSAKGSPSRAASASARSTRSASSARLGRPVSASVWASVSMRWLAAMRSVMSRNDQTRPTGRPRLHCGCTMRSSTRPECSSSMSLACSSVASAMAARRCA